MKNLLAACLLLWVVAGCTNRDIDTAKLQAAFQSAEAPVQADLQMAIVDINASNYSAALPNLQHVAYAAKLTKEQRLLIEDSLKKAKARANAK